MRVSLKNIVDGLAETYRREKQAVFDTARQGDLKVEESRQAFQEAKAEVSRKLDEGLPLEKIRLRLMIGEFELPHTIEFDETDEEFYMTEDQLDGRVRSYLIRTTTWDLDGASLEDEEAPTVAGAPLYEAEEAEEVGEDEGEEIELHDFFEELEAEKLNDESA